MKSINGNRAGLILTATESRQADTFTIQNQGVQSAILMGWAGQSAFLFCNEKKYFHRAEKIYIFCGSGNNGGDGYVFAWHTLLSTDKLVFIVRENLPVTPDASYYAGLIENLTQDSTFHQRITYVDFQSFINGKNFSSKKILFIEALFGTGLSRPLDISYSQLAKKYNEANVKKISLDIPAGVSSDGDNLSSVIFRADITLVFSNLKVGHVTEPGIFNCGKTYVLHIGIIRKPIVPNRRLSRPDRLPPLRKMEGHKYISGSVFILGGFRGYEGAGLMAGKAFLGTGGGIVKIFSNSGTALRILKDSPELMLQTSNSVAKLLALFLESIRNAKEPAVAIIGPGYSAGIDEKFLVELFQTPLKGMIFDGGALRHLKAHFQLFQERPPSCVILTPHKGEAESMLGKKIGNVYHATRELRDTFHSMVYLKGPGGVFLSPNASDDEIFFSSQNYGLATAGTGDVLTGYIASALCRKGPAFSLVENGITAYIDAAQRIKTIEKMEKEDSITASMLYKGVPIKKRGKF